MAFTFGTIKDEVKRRATRDQGGTQFDTGIENLINTSIFRVGREAGWRSARRTSHFDTVGTYTTGSGGGTFTNDSTAVTITGATLITDNIKIGQRIKLQGDSTYFTIRTITGETTLTLDQKYGGTTIAGTGTYSILGQEEYNLPVQAGHRLFLWHEDYGYPLLLRYIPDLEFYSGSYNNTTESTPTHYRMWGEDMAIRQPLEASAVTIASSSASDTNVSVTVFGTVSSYPDYEVITTDAADGTTSVSGSKSFTSIERVVKDASTVGRITATTNSGNVTVAVLPVGDTTAGILYRKVQLWPLPDSIIPVNVWYYKDPYRLVNDNDVHELGQDFDEAIILLAVAKLKYEQDQLKGGDKFMDLYRDEIRNLKRTNIDKIDWFPTMRRPGASTAGGPHPFLSYRQVGSHFGPAGRL